MFSFFNMDLWKHKGYLKQRKRINFSHVSSENMYINRFLDNSVLRNPMKLRLESSKYTDWVSFAI